MLETEIAKAAIELWRGDSDSLRYVGGSANRVLPVAAALYVSCLRLEAGL